MSARADVRTDEHEHGQNGQHRASGDVVRNSRVQYGRRQERDAEMGNGAERAKEARQCDRELERCLGRLMRSHESSPFDPCNRSVSR